MIRKPEQGSDLFLQVKARLPDKDSRTRKKKEHKRVELKQTTIILVA
jgi:hypothetical protein